MSFLADLLSTLFDRRSGVDVSVQVDAREIETLAAELLTTESESAALQLAQSIFSTYASMDSARKIEFFQTLMGEFDIDPNSVRDALAVYEAGPSRDSYAAYLVASEPGRQELIRRLNRLPGATGDLVAMRSDLLRLARKDAALSALDLDFRHLFTSWFNRGFLVLRPISWQSPASILEKIIAYEAVHEITDWESLQHRLAPTDRRCYAFFHPAMPDEPLIFVEVALTKGVPSAIGQLLEGDRPAVPADKADTAVFYSISNCQPGLAGISFGNALIKQVVADLKLELPRLNTFVTLSPIPSLAKWVEAEGLEMDVSDPGSIRALAARYLMSARRSDGQPLDPVARFHLFNGASLHAVHADADPSPKGLAQSGGAMVNYLYDLEQVERNHEAYVSERKISAAAAVRALVENPTKTKKTPDNTDA